MGAAVSGRKNQTQTRASQVRVNAEIERKLLEERIANGRLLKILLLGEGTCSGFTIASAMLFVPGGPECGKSTICKQMR